MPYDAKTTDGVKSEAFRHYSGGIVEKDTHTLWMIDTWADVVLPYAKWTQTDFTMNNADL